MKTDFEKIYTILDFSALAGILGLAVIEASLAAVFAFVFVWGLIRSFVAIANQDFS